MQRPGYLRNFQGFGKMPHPHPHPHPHIPHGGGGKGGKGSPYPYWPYGPVPYWDNYPLDPTVIESEFPSAPPAMITDLVNAINAAKKAGNTALVKSLTTKLQMLLNP